jgi:hypothetical protein
MGLSPTFPNAKGSSGAVDRLCTAKENAVPMKKRHSLTVIANLAFLAGFALVGLIALCPAADAQSVYACINNKTTAVRVVASASKCRKTETAQQLAPAGETQVLDNSNAIIGRYQLIGSGGGAVTKFAGTTVLLLIDGDGSAGFLQGRPGVGGELTFWHTTEDCSGTRYMLGGIDGVSKSMISVATVFSGNAYFPALPYQNLHINSIESIQAGEDPTQTGQCDVDSGNGGLYPLGSAHVENVSVFTPPFHLTN